MSVKVQLDGVNRKLSSQNFARGRYAMGNQMLSDMNPFVPRKEGSLRSTGHITSDGKKLAWTTPYARAQFYGSNGKATFRKYSTTGTGKRWDLKAKSIHLKDWKKAFVKGSGIN